MYSFQSFVSDSVWFPSAAQCLCEGLFFYAFSSHVLNTLRQHIWCSHFLCNVCTWKPHSGTEQCVFLFESRVHSATNRKNILFAKAIPMFSDWLDSVVPDSGAPTCCFTFEDVWKCGVFLFYWKCPHIYIGDQNPLSISSSMTASEQVLGRETSTKDKGRDEWSWLFKARRKHGNFSHVFWILSMSFFVVVVALNNSVMLCIFKLDKMVRKIILQTWVWKTICLSVWVPVASLGQIMLKKQI